jgi:hypothetical protein
MILRSHRFRDAGLKLSPYLVLAATLFVWGCAQQGGTEQGYRVVQVSYQFEADNRQTREWRALLHALDECHLHGYQDAQPVGPPQTICQETVAQKCVRFQASVSYDCIGMGYQTAS